MTQFGGIYSGKRVLVTGHTGFKGSWLTLWLKKLGAEIAGVSLTDEVTNSHWSTLGIPVTDFRLDIRNYDAFAAVINEFKPSLVFHLAAQPLVRRSYRFPLETWSTNVMGTSSVLEACRNQTSVKAIVVVTTDKCYRNLEQIWPYREIDELGGHDPYSASKAAAEILVSSYRDSFFSNGNILLASARAGNVIGGGDWAEDRLIPDAIRAIQNRVSLEIRSPKATRPWQHVLEPLSGYLTLGQKLLEGEKQAASAWNFGPDRTGNQSVECVLGGLQASWPLLNWHMPQSSTVHEANLLHLDSTKAAKLLNWSPVWEFQESLQRTSEWYRAWVESNQVVTHQQLDEYTQTAAERCRSWAC